MQDSEERPVDGDAIVSTSVDGPRLLRTVGSVVAFVLTAGLLLTLVATVTSYRLERSNERRLLVVQTRQAAAVVSAAIVSLQAPLQTAAAVSAATQGDPQAFRAFMTSYTGPTSLFVAASLWRLNPAGQPTPLAAIGTTPALDPASSSAQQLRLKATRSAGFVVQAVNVGVVKRIAYAIASKPDDQFVVLAERAIPANRRVPVENGSAFSDLHFATYLGRSTATADMQTTDVAPARLPLRGDVATEAVPFGDTSVTLATSPAGHLGGALSAGLPWIALGGGLLLTLCSAVISGELSRRRARAEADARTISELYTRLDTRFSQQRSISETLQRALLPQTNPAVPELEIATRYVAGARGVDVGGDWYTMIRLDEDRFAFVVGDVSGRGVEAAVLMGRIKFTLRAYLVEGHPPETALSLCSGQVSVTRDGHIATAIVGVGDTRAGMLRLANAGHLSPLLCTAADASFIDTSVGLPLGVRPCAYEGVDVELPLGATLVAYTDGLIERRDESITDGLRRLAAAVPRDGALEDRLSALIGALAGHDTEDDIAVLAFRRLPSPHGPHIDRDRADLDVLTR